MNKIQTTPITISLEREAHVHARHFAAQQTTISKGKKVYLNTLAVYAVAYYLKWLQIESDLQKSDSWQPVIQLISDSADLFIPHVGRLECCPVLPEANCLTIAPIATEERIGYVAVKFEDNLERVKLIGFLPAVSPSRESQQIPLTKLQSLELLLENISQPVTQTAKETEPQIIVNLGKWWSEIFEPSWLSLETLFRENSLVAPAWKVRTKEPEAITDEPIRVRRGKLIDLGGKLGNELVTLVVTCTTTARMSQGKEEYELPMKPGSWLSGFEDKGSKASEPEIDILLQVYPNKEQVYLPANLELIVLDETNTLVSELRVKARDADNYIQLSLSGYPGERFSVTLSLKEISFTETFQL
ncbi:MAG: DUF1822 family protein [Xenococcaceae cyanobacterium]